MRIGIVAPSCRLSEAAAAEVEAVAAELGGIEPVFHPQCFLEEGHFAGTDAQRLAAFVDYANDPGFDAIWFARGGYGAGRIAEEGVAALGPDARGKIYMGYSDAGFLLAALYRAGFARVAHGPMPQDALRDGGGAAIRRALAWMSTGAEDALEPKLDPARPHAAFNLTVLGLLMGTKLEPDLAGHVLILEDVDEHAYRTDRAMFHLTGQAAICRVAGIRLGRFSAVPPNNPDFGATAEQIVRYWCERMSIPFLGEADIGHDAGNKVVPFGTVRRGGG